jgi:hypothetical protein
MIFSLHSSWPILTHMHISTAPKCSPVIGHVLHWNPSKALTWLIHSLLLSFTTSLLPREQRGGHLCADWTTFDPSCDRTSMCQLVGASGSDVAREKNLEDSWKVSFISRPVDLGSTYSYSS